VQANAEMVDFATKAQRPKECKKYQLGCAWA